MPDRILVDKLYMFHKRHISRQTAVSTRHHPFVVITTRQRSIKDISHKRRFSRPAHSGYHRHDIKRETHVDIFQVIMHGAFYLDVIVPRPSLHRNGNAFSAGKIFGSITTLGIYQSFYRTLIDDFSSQTPGLRADVDDIIGRADNVFVVLDDNYCITQLLKPTQNLNKQSGIARMQPYTRFVENIKRTDQTATQRCRQIDTLALTARKRR